MNNDSAQAIESEDNGAANEGVAENSVAQPGKGANSPAQHQGKDEKTVAGNILDYQNSAEDSPNGPGAEKGGVTVEEMAEELGKIQDEEDKKFAENFIKVLGKSGFDKKRADEFLKDLAGVFEPEDPTAFFKKELGKLGPSGREIIEKARTFRDEMRKTEEFSEEDVAALEQMTQTDGDRTAENYRNTEQRNKGAIQKNTVLITYCLFNDTDSSFDYIASNCRTINEY